MVKQNRVAFPNANALIEEKRKMIKKIKKKIYFLMCVWM